MMKFENRKWFLRVAPFVLLLLLLAPDLKGEEIIAIDDITPGDLLVRGFEMKDRGPVELDMVAGKRSYAENFFAYGWIINAETREPVWSAIEETDLFDRIGEQLWEIRQELTLQPGKYEAYYFAADPKQFFTGINVSVKNLGDIIDIIGDIFKDDDKEKDNIYTEDASEWYFRITTDASANTYTPSFSTPEPVIAAFRDPGHNFHKDVGFTLDRDMELDIYAVGEFGDRYELFVDGGWIINADTREVVWTMDKWNTDHAGGARKNRYFHNDIDLPAGNYVANYVTDDSHDSDNWNMPPPNDPFNYGMVIKPVDDDDMQFVSDFDDTMSGVEIVRMDRVPNGTLRKQGFTLKKDAHLWIYGLGERYYSQDKLADYGWIIDADNLARVWEMTAENTTFAGGDAKNCKFDGIVELPEGNYIAYYRTDGSHAYDDWNAAPPFDRKAWGMKVSAVDKDFDSTDFELFEQSPMNGNVLVNMTGLGDNAYEEYHFELPENTSVRITALGEGKSGHMYDYGWIEQEDTGDIVWEMTYRKTRHAGGANKNRIVVTNLLLEKGKYVAHFETDDSHSFYEFNASPPDNPELWGMMIVERK
jgi:hypothetical protein